MRNRRISPRRWFAAVLCLAIGALVIATPAAPSGPGHGLLGALRSLAKLAALVTGVGLLAPFPWLRPALRRLDTASLRARLALSLALAAALPLVLTASLNGEQDQRTALSGALAGQEAVAATMAEHVASYVGLHAAAVTALAAQQGLPGRSPAALAEELRAVKRAYPDVTVFSLYDAAGRGVARSDDLPLVQAGSTSMDAEVRRTGGPAIAIRQSPILPPLDLRLWRPHR